MFNGGVFCQQSHFFDHVWLMNHVHCILFESIFLFSVDNIAESDILSQSQSANHGVSLDFATQLLDSASALQATLELTAVR